MRRINITCACCISTALARVKSLPDYRAWPTLRRERKYLVKPKRTYWGVFFLFVIDSLRYSTPSPARPGVQII